MWVARRCSNSRLAPAFFLKTSLDSRLVVLFQVYSKSVAFGYALASARERRALEATLLRPLPEIVEVGDDDVPFPLCEPQDPQQQLRGRDVAPAASPVAEPACPALATFLYTGWWRSQALQMDRASPALALAQQVTHQPRPPSLPAGGTITGCSGTERRVGADKEAEMNGVRLRGGVREWCTLGV